MDCVCITKVSIKKLAQGKIRANITMLHNGSVQLKSESSINTVTGHLFGVKSRLRTTVSLNPKPKYDLNVIALKPQDNSKITGTLSLSGVLHGRLKSNSTLFIPYTEKLGGSFDIDNYKQFNCREKLYPVEDVVINSGDNYFVDKTLGSSGLYLNIDEGIFSKEYDERTTYIQPSSIYTEGDFKYKFRVNNPNIRPQTSLLLIRASAPLYNDSSKTAPLYKFSNIRFEDPSGNLIIKYKDFTIRGDANYEEDYVNFATYISEPEINNAILNTWDSSYPFLASGSFSENYTVNLDLNIECLDDPFDDGYDKGYEDSCALDFVDTERDDYLAIDGAPLATQNNSYSLNPTNSLRITAIELCNSGELSTFNENYLTFYTDVSSTGLRITRNIFPNQVLLNTSYNEIYPSSDSTWIYEDIELNTFDNSTASGANVLVPLIRDNKNSTFVSLNYSSIEDSGKLKLRFGHEPPSSYDGYSNGAFSFGNFSQNKNFDNAKWSNIADTDNFFTIDSVELKVVAKKTSGSRNYSLDVVGYSDDKLLHVTSKVGGFLQNLENSGVGTAIPTSSGFYGIDDLGISTEAFSDKSQYFETNTTNNDGGDHYLLSTYPVINSTNFEEYTIPLKIYEDNVLLGQSTDYSMSSFFENLYLDIYPIPSGASISKIWLSVKYKPSNGLMLHTIGQADKEFVRRRLTLLPNEDVVSSSGSLISNIPHAYTRDETLKTNYSTRWKGIYGTIVAGPYNPNEFDFSFYNPQMYTPYLNGYFSFNYDSGNSIISDYSYERSRLDSVISGTYIGNYEKVNNLGLRFNSQSLFNESTTNTTIDWTRIAGYENDSLYGRITDNFENAIRVSGNLGYINFSNINPSGGFAISTRFSPDINMSGVGYNLWNSGVIFSKYDSGEDLEFLVGFENGFLIARAKDINGSIISLSDSKNYTEYTYPLSLLLTYNDNNTNQLKLFTNSIVDTSDTFVIHSGNSNLTFGYSSGSGVGINGFLTEIGISTSIGPSGHPTDSGINIIQDGTVNNQAKQIIYSDLKRSLYDYIDIYTDTWHLGAFKVCEFNQDYDRFTNREGSGILLHHLNHNGSGYSQTTDITLPSNINLEGVAYHTQIENDFVRFGLQDTADSNPNFYSAHPRISKTLPRGYSFMDEAFAIDTIINYETYDDIIWSDGKVGPKLVVSLYTPNKEPISYPTTNYGLINRYTHYLEPSGCWQKITSKFDFNSLIDKSEPWADFNEDQYLTEFNHKYFSKDIDDMFLQYDLIYPSGNPFESTIKIYGINVRLENALVSKSGINDNLSLSVSGQGIWRDNLNLSTPLTYSISDKALSMYTEMEIIGVSSGSLNLSCSGATLSSGYMPLHSITIGRIDNFVTDLFGSTSPLIGLGLYASGQLFREEGLPLFVDNDQFDLYKPSETLETLLLSIYNKPLKDSNIGSIDLYINGKTRPIITSPSSRMSLVTQVSSVYVDFNELINLFVNSFNPKELSNTLSLFTVNYPILDVELGNQSISWDINNVGVDIDVSDNFYSSLSADDEIRGVELICYGGCDG